MVPGSAELELLSSGLRYALDTASATLLMVGAGVVAKPEPWLCDQAARDLAGIRASRDVELVTLLTGLASGSLDPGDPVFRRRCSLTAARLRRLFTEADPLLSELRTCIEHAERNGVSVRFAERGLCPRVPVEARCVLIAPAVAMLAAASVARVSVVGAPESVTVSVVSDSPPESVPAVSCVGVSMSTVRCGQRIWVETTWMRGE
ncbi:hypothetical protein LWC34_52635 [Kibdelosporangium philippinense]|uniref:Uncharacterized protein n=1 Tax=Kibdelosporangium philippinense TaxID=211113 RepID=A0ABS8ZUI3_9PSEU|nr:hypothetical protein [Kibdelosporangium philippinense]MCE7011404.1 hypothetical protein [Kibdelosporangium philippinense]